MSEKARDLAPLELDRRLMEEINILKLEGALFCFDPRAARKRRGILTLAGVLEQPVTIHIHPDFGQPSVLAYKVLQAIFLKLAEQGYDLTEDGRHVYSDTVSFSQRELAALAGRSSWGGSASKQLYQAVMQLRSTQVNASLREKGTDRWQLANFQVLTSAYFSGRGETITRCAVRFAPEVMTSLNRRHVAFFNLHRLNQLDTIGLVLYKRVFFHLSNLMHESKPRGALKFTKDYGAICEEWLGGLTPLRYRSDILKDQLGRHLDGLQATGLIRRYGLEKNKAGDGFNLTVYPGKGFFDDYQAYYGDTKQPRLRFRAAAELAEVRALELVAHFHRQLGRTDRTRFEDHETAYADELLTIHSEEEIRDLIAYAIEQAAKTKYDMLFFGGIKPYVEAWSVDQARMKERRRQAQAMERCPFCNEAGYLELKGERGRLIAHPCPHRLELVTQIEDRLKAFRV